MYKVYLHEYRHYDQSIGAFCSFCIICVQLMIVVDQLNLEHKEKRSRELQKEKHQSDSFSLNIMKVLETVTIK